jgi:hypothetical protein
MKRIESVAPLAVLVIACGLAFALVLGGCSGDEEAAEPESEEVSETAEDPADEEPAATEDTPEPEGADDPDAVYVGVFHIDEEGAVFPDIELRSDGTAAITTYSGQTVEGTWAVDEEQYLTLETDDGERIGGMTIQYDDGFEMAYVGKYVRVE